MAGSQGIYRTPMQGMVEPSAHGTPNQFADVALSRQGAAIVQDQLLYWAISGRMFQAQMGDAMSKLVFVETAYDEDQPQWALNVPAGKTVIPTSLVLTAEIQSSTGNHVVWSTMDVAIGNGTSVAGTITPLRTDQPHSSGCTARSLYTGNGATPSNLIEFVRFLDMFAAVSTGPVPRYEWNIRTAGSVPVLVGPATLQMHAIGVADFEGYGEFVWAEFDTPALVDKA